MEVEQIFEILKALIPYIITLGLGAIGGWELVKSKVTKMKVFFETVETALYDNTVTEKEFVDVWEAGKDVFKK